MISNYLLRIETEYGKKTISYINFNCVCVVKYLEIFKNLSALEQQQQIEMRFQFLTACRYGEYCILGCDAVYSVRYLQTFRRNVPEKQRGRKQSTFLCNVTKILPQNTSAHPKNSDF